MNTEECQPPRYEPSLTWWEKGGKQIAVVLVAGVLMISLTTVLILVLMYCGFFGGPNDGN